MLGELTPATGNQLSDLASLCLAIIEHAPLPMVAAEGTNHIVRYVNPAFCRLIDKSKDELIGKPLGEMLPEKDACGTLLARVFRTGKPERHTERQHSKPGPVFWSYTIWPVIADERPVGVITQVIETAQFYENTLAMNEALMLGSVRQHELTEAANLANVRLQEEITARQETARELAEKARLLELSTDAIAVLDCEYRILYWSHGAEELYGWPREEALGKVSYSLLQTEFPTPLEKITEELHRTGRWTGELVHTKRDGQRITVLARKVLDRDSQGKPAAILENMTDFTQRKKMEDELSQAHAQLTDRAGQLEGLVSARTAELTATNSQLEAFVYSIAHDLRAPLRAIQGFSTMLVDEAGAALSETGKGYADRVDKSAQFMDALLSDLLAFSRISQQHVELTSVNLQSVVESLLSRLQEDIQEKNARVESSGPWPVVLAHEPTLTQVFFNLVSNALKFVAPGVPPRVRLRAEVVEASERGSVEASERELAAHAPRSTLHAPPVSTVRVWVEDNGPGIAPDHQGQIFRLFTRLDGEKYAGTGIGLAIVQKGVERMRGRVGVESIPGQGSRFWFELKKA